MAWLIGWYRRKPKLVRGSTAGGQTNYQLKLTIYKGSGTDTGDTIYLGGYANNDFSDLRFTSSDETTPLPYWIESYISGVSAIVWIKIDSIPADPFSKTIYIYYDNPIAPGTGTGTGNDDGPATFPLLFDHFLGTTLDTGKWTTTACNSYSISGSILTVNRQTCQNSDFGILSNTAFGNFTAFRTKLNLPWGSCGGSWNYNCFGYGTGGHWGSNMVIIAGSGNWTCNALMNFTSGWGAVGISGDANTHIWEIQRTNSASYVAKDNAAVAGPLSTQYPTTAGDVGFQSQTSAAGSIVVDWALVRTYVNPEPIWSTTSPEQIYTASLAISSIPSGAKIYINNQDYNIYTDISVILNPGTYAILLTKAGYQDYTEIIVLSSNQNAIVQGNLILATTGNLDISSTPSGAEIFLAPTGSPLVDQTIVTPSTISFSPGTYDYKLTHVDYYDATGSFTITSGLTTTLNIILTHLQCSITTKNIGDILTLQATPIQGVAPYTVEFRRANSQNMVNIIDTTNIDGETYLIPTIRLGGSSNPVLGVAEGITTTRLYTIDITDINDATSKVPGDGASLLFASKMLDSCIPSQSCVKYCKVFVACAVPVCDFVVT